MNNRTTCNKCSFIHPGFNCLEMIHDMNIIKECFGGNTQKVWVEDDKIKVAITENENWSLNKCILRDWFFDYNKFKTTGYQMDCESYGVYVFWK